MRRIYFGLASNAHALLSGASLDSVRRRIKLASLLNDEVYLEAGSMQIQAGPTGSIAWRNLHSTPRWQTPRAREHLQGSEFSLSVGPPNQPSPASEMREAMRSRSAIAWEPTFEPFGAELSGSDWIRIGQFQPLSPEQKNQARVWRLRDEQDPAIVRKLPDHLVRHQVISGIEEDLSVAVAHGLHASVDRLHAAVFGSRLADSSLKASGFALPILLPQVGNLSWTDIRDIRREKSLEDLRSALRTFELDVLAEVLDVGDVSPTLQRRYAEQLESLANDVPKISKTLAIGIAEIAVGGAMGFATTGMSWIGAVLSATPGLAVTGTEVVATHRRRRGRRWISALQVMRDKARE